MNGSPPRPQCNRGGSASPMSTSPRNEVVRPLRWVASFALLAGLFLVLHTGSASAETAPASPPAGAQTGTQGTSSTGASTPTTVAPATPPPTAAPATATPNTTVA